MPTIKDIAQRAGVSHGTVSNVLNKRGNVSAEKIQLVEQAAKELGYKINAQAQQLRAGVAKRVCVILPGINYKRYNDFYTGLEPALRSWGFDIELYCTNQIIQKEIDAVRKALSQGTVALVCISSLIKNKALYPEDSHLIFVERRFKHMPEDATLICFDYTKAGREVAEQCLRQGHKNIALLSGSCRYSNYRDFVSGATAVLED